MLYVIRREKLTLFLMVQFKLDVFLRTWPVSHDITKDLFERESKPENQENDKFIKYESETT